MIGFLDVEPDWLRFHGVVVPEGTSSRVKVAVFEGKLLNGDHLPPHFTLSVAEYHACQGLMANGKGRSLCTNRAE
jgi:hypothetical protein